MPRPAAAGWAAGLLRLQLTGPGCHGDEAHVVAVWSRLPPSGRYMARIYERRFIWPPRGVSLPRIDGYWTVHMTDIDLIVLIPWAITGSRQARAGAGVLGAGSTGDDH